MSTAETAAGGPDVPVEAAEVGVRWSRGQLYQRLVAAAGVTRSGHLDTAAAGELAGVSARTVRRWMHGPAEEIVGMRDSSREAVVAGVRPGARKLRQEVLDGGYAREAIREINLPKRRRRIPQMWQERDWLSQHMVAVIDLPQAYSRQLAVARMTQRPLQRLRRRGQIIDFTEVPSRFHATVLSTLVLDLVDPWRVQLAKSWVEQGHAQAWILEGAPAFDLAEVAVTNRLR